VVVVGAWLHGLLQTIHYLSVSPLPSSSSSSSSSPLVFSCHAWCSGDVVGVSDLALASCMPCVAACPNVMAAHNYYSLITCMRTQTHACVHEHTTEVPQWGDLDPGLFAEHGQGPLDEPAWGALEAGHHAPAVSHAPAGGGWGGEERSVAAAAVQARIVYDSSAGHAHEPGPAASHAPTCVSSDVIIIDD